MSRLSSSSSTSSSGLSPHSSPHKPHHESTPLLSQSNHPSTISNTINRIKQREPHAFWLVPILLLMAISLGMNTGPKLEIHTQLICRSISMNKPNHLEFETEINSSGAFLTNAHSDWVKKCRKDPLVSSKVSLLSSTISLVMGSLSVLTTAFWCSISERIGRRLILSLGFFGFILNDASFLLIISLMRSKILKDYKLLIIPSILEGLFGGPATIQAIFNSYISDCFLQDPSLNSDSKTITFSLFLGLMMAGMAIGPTISSKIVDLKDDILLPFYIILILLIFVFGFSLYVIPESLSKLKQIEFKNQHQLVLNQLEISYNQSINQNNLHPKIHFYHTRLSFYQFRKLYLNFLKPLLVLWPTKSIDQNGQNPIRDWKLTLIGMAYALYGSGAGAYGIKLQYAIFRFQWGPIQTGYFLTTLGICRVMALLVIIPMVIRLWKKSTTVVNLESPSSRPIVINPSNKKYSLLSSSSRLGQSQLQPEPITISIPKLNPLPNHRKTLNDAKFDLKFARYSIIWDGLSIIILIISPSISWFIIGSGMQSLSGSTSSALQALALNSVTHEKIGKVIASFSILQVLMSQVLGPFLFGGVFSGTVGRFSESFLVVDLLLMVIVLVVLSMLRLSSHHHPSISNHPDLSSSISSASSSSDDDDDDDETDEVIVQPCNI
ncbi:uncharacterized protein MELLADRAFT_116202 [Melampsora larici-populina 98AG31]|uniref:Major facilitator superfamily (MFS) profile domain-containing protein n=1 Tax=Melampsora larici-populina (strain 98AG31 / pathotype 3-4-7) TaxID=747676 RepID=F4RIU1_MELLP|nr:uncharacterized protein MELLADRAFT_116202 [Melampsora larici-populina 98AG31]EGG07623.1 hypothetical protein MELLADRAFT_116202 [Melampsora larici-populina 98AG31]